MHEDRLRWLIEERKTATLAGAVEITKGAPDILRRMEIMRNALEIIAGKRQCLDNLMSHADVANEALKVAFDNRRGQTTQ